MSDILIKPPELHKASQNLESSARKIQASLEKVNDILESLGPARFEGQRAVYLRGHHRRLHGNLRNAHKLILRMAQQLEEIAASFEKADRKISDERSLLQRILDGLAFWKNPQLPWRLPDIKPPDIDGILPIIPVKPKFPEWVGGDDEHVAVPEKGTGNEDSQENAADSPPTTDSAKDSEYPPNAANVERSKDVIDDLDVTKTARYQKKLNAKTGKYDTYCNIFAMDYAKKMGVPLPEYLDWNKDGKIDRYLNANQAVAWLRGTFNEGGGAVQQGPALGWKTVSASDAADMSSKGYVVIAGYENQGGIGHMAVVRPESTADQIRIAQAGWNNFENGTIKDGFGDRKVEYFVYLPS